MATDDRKLEKTRTPGVYRRGARYVVTYRDPSGRPRKRFAPTLAAAKDLQASLRADISRGEYRALSKTTFGEYAPEWIRSYRGRTARGIGPDTIHDYRRMLGLDDQGEPTGAAAVAFFGRMQLAAIGAPDLRRYADHVAKAGRRRGTVRLYLAPVKALLATAHEDGLIRSNPAVGLRNLLPADADRETELVKALTAEELSAVLEQLPEAWRGFFGFLAETGLRIGEAVELRWSDVDLGTGWLTVSRRFYRGRVGPPKGRKSRRVRLSKTTQTLLWALRKESRAGNGDLVWTVGDGCRVDQSNLMTRELKPAAVAAGVGDWIVVNEKGARRADTWVGFHTFRHTCATMLFRAGWNAAQVQRHLGHSDPGFTLRRYVHLLDADVPEPTLLDSLPAAVRGNSGATQPAETGRNEGPRQAAEVAV